MCGQQLKQSLSAILKNVKLLGDLISQLNDQSLTHISAVVARVAHYNSIRFLVHRDLSTGLLPFEEFSEEWFHEGDI